MAARGSPCLGRQPALSAAARGLPSGRRARRAPWQLACKLGQGSLHNPIGIGAAGKSTQHDDAATVELRLNACSDCAARERAIRVVSERKRGLRVGDEARGAYSRTQRQAQACVGYFFAVREGSAPAMRAVMPVAGRVFANARTRGSSAGRG